MKILTSVLYFLYRYGFVYLAVHLSTIHKHQCKSEYESTAITYTYMVYTTSCPYGIHLQPFVVFASSRYATLQGDIDKCVYHSGCAAL